MFGQRVDFGWPRGAEFFQVLVNGDRDDQPSTVIALLAQQG
jgi:hypothetical protein